MRLRTIKPEPAKGAMFPLGDFQIQLRDGLLFRQGKRVAIQPQPMKALLYLVSKQGSLVTREELARHLWPGDFVDDGQSLNVVMRNLRRALGDDPKHPVFIETVPTKGYRLLESVSSGSRFRQFRYIHMAVAATLILGLILMIADIHQGSVQEHAGTRSAETLPEPAKIAYISGRKYLSENNVTSARSEFAKVTKLAPEFAGGYLWLAKSYSGFWGTGLESAERAEPLLLQALEIDPDLADAYAELGAVALIKDLDAERALELAQASLKLDPQNVSARFVQMDAQLARGRPEDARAFLEKINQIDPLRLTGRATEGWVAFMAGDYDAAAKACHIALQSGAGMAQSARTCLLETYLAQHEMDLAVEQAGALLELTRAPDTIVEEFRSKQAKAALQVYFAWRLGAIQSNANSNPYSEAIYLLKLGYLEDAVDRLQQVVDQRQYPHITFMKNDRRLQALTRHPEGGRLLDLFGD